MPPPWPGSILSSGPGLSGPNGPLAAGAAPYAMIEAAIVARLAASLNVSQQYIVPVAADEYPLPDLEPYFVVVRSYGVEPTNAQGLPFPDMGAGRAARVVKRRIRCYIYSRSSLDRVGADNIALEGQDPTQTYQNATSPGTPNPGQYAIEETVLNALDDWTPVAGGRNLCLDVIHWVPTGGESLRKPEEDTGVIRSSVDFEVEYISAIRPIDPAQ